MSDASLGNDLTSRVLHYALDGLTLQQNVISNNVSNAQTPNYSDTEVDFESSLNTAMATPSPGTTAGAVVSASGNAPGSDGNNVNMSDELVEVSRATLQYQAVVQALNFKYNQLTNAMQEPAVTT